MPITIGTAFPSFKLKDMQGETYTNETMQGHGAVFVFYPGDMTPGCTMQLCSIRDDWQDFHELGILVFGINQASSSSHKKFNELHHFPFPLLVDEEKKLSQAVGAIRKIFGFTIIKRTVIGVDQQGIIRFIRPGMPKDAEILKAMKPYATLNT